jgi:hypothetical protein
VAGFVAEELPSMLTAAGSIVTPQVKVTVEVKFGSKYDSDPNVRMSQLLNDSENLRKARIEKARFWGTSQPSCLPYERLNGAIGP